MKTALVFNLSTLEEGFELLLKNKLDAVVATDHIGKYLAELYVNRGKIVWSELEIISTKTSNLAISKKSPAIKHLEAFKKAAQKLAKAGAFDIPQIN